MKIVVAMSGGVDSSVAAALLHEQGHEVIGVHMKLHNADPDKAGACCGLDDALDARRVADTLGIAFHVMDLRDAFRKAVIQDLTESYLAGFTPNPCIQCNGVLKFRVLLQRAMALGAEKLATGHYARIGPGPGLFTARDTGKDQTYFLFPLTELALNKTLFPLGDLTKDQVRAHAARFGLVTADKPESQEICFIPDGDHAAFIARERPELDGSGPIVDTQGRELGWHDGYFRFTVGQRRGLGVSVGTPVYVSHIDPDTCTVVVSGGEALWHHGLVARSWTWFDRPDPQERVDARIRHQGRRIPCHVGPGDQGAVSFEVPAWAVAPGQAVVIYRGDRVLGGGWIKRAMEAG
jgi:tRNA-specific 2-thiouridylase